MNKKGFTLIEIAMTVLIIGIITTFIVLQFGGVDEIGKDAKRKSDIEIIKNAILTYRNENYNNVPIFTCNIGETCSEDFNSSLSPYIGSLPEPDPDTVYSYSSTDGESCSLSALLSDGSLYVYNCLNEEFVTIFPVAGACGPSSMQSFDTEPTSGLCSSGTATPLNFNNNNLTWSWDCEGENGGATTHCLAFFETNYFACSIVSREEACPVSPEHQDDPSVHQVALFNLASLTGGHAELASGINYPYKVCCEGSSLTDSGSTTTTVLTLSGVTNAHAEKGNSFYYSDSYDIKLSAPLKTITCTYATDCSTLGVCVASISDGNTNLHVGDCDAYPTKICCGMQ